MIHPWKGIIDRQYRSNNGNDNPTKKHCTSVHDAINLFSYTGTNLCPQNLFLSGEVTLTYSIGHVVLRSALSIVTIHEMKMRVYVILYIVNNIFLLNGHNAQLNRQLLPEKSV